MDILDIIRNLLLAALPILISITFHEAAHGYIANKLGDPTAKMLGRVTFNPLAHIDLFGTIIIPLVIFISSQGRFMFGSAKPVPVTFQNLRKPRRDTALVALAGPAANIIISFLSILVFALTLKMFSLPSFPASLRDPLLTPLSKMLDFSIIFNVYIAAFNLIPIPPLDGGRIFASLLPNRLAYSFGKIEPYGIFIVLGLWFLGIAQYIITPIQMFIQLILKLFLTPFGLM